jgi:hypothetical protein
MYPLTVAYAPSTKRFARAELAQVSSLMSSRYPDLLEQIIVSAMKVATLRDCHQTVGTTESGNGLDVTAFSGPQEIRPNR